MMESSLILVYIQRVTADTWPARHMSALRESYYLLFNAKCFLSHTRIVSKNTCQTAINLHNAIAVI